MSTHRREDGNTRALLIGFVVAAIVNVFGNATGVGILAGITKPFLMLLLFTWAWQVMPSPKPKAGKYLLVGILFAWLGDMVLMFASRDASGNLYFMLGIGAFFVMQVLYILAFLSIPGTHMLRKAPLLVIPFVLYWGFMNYVMDPGRMFIPVLFYSIVLVGMSVVALDLVPRLPSPQGWRVFIGSVFFVVSDSLIAMDAFGSLDWGRWQVVSVMTTYVIAQYLIVTGVCRGLVLRDSADSQELAPPVMTTA